MGKQSSRIYYQGIDHKDIFYKEKYHDKMYIGSKLVWEKLYGGRHIPYIASGLRGSFLNVLYIDSRDIISVYLGWPLTQPLVRGKNVVSCILIDTSIMYSTNGEKFQITESVYNKENASLLSYSSQKDNIFWMLEPDGIQYNLMRLMRTDLKTLETVRIAYGSLSGRGENIISGIINPELNIFLFTVAEYRSSATPPYYKRLYAYKNDEKKEVRFEYGGTPFGDDTIIALGADNENIYMYYVRYRYGKGEEHKVVSYNFDGVQQYIPKDVTDTEIKYDCIKSSLYKNGEFIVYFSIEGKLEIYTTKNFLDFTKKKTAQYVYIEEIGTKQKKKISFDESVEGEWYIQPYCNLDNTYYFDNEGAMHENAGCIFYDEKGMGIERKHAIFYFDNLYFEESDGNFCKFSD